METTVKVFKKKKKTSYMRKYTNEIIGSFSMIYVVKKYHAYLSVYQFIECSVGYSGDNCSVVCPSDSYGKLCSRHVTDTLYHVITYSVAM